MMEQKPGKTSEALPRGTCFTDWLVDGIEALLKRSRPDQNTRQLLRSIFNCFGKHLAFNCHLIFLYVPLCYYRRRWRKSLEPSAKGRWEAVGDQSWEEEQCQKGREMWEVEKQKGQNWGARKWRFWTLLSWRRSKWCFLLEWWESVKTSEAHKEEYLKCQQGLLYKWYTKYIPEIFLVYNLPRL